MKPGNLLSRQIAARAAAEGGGAPLVITACGPDGAPEPLRTWDDATGEPVLWDVHCVNEEPGGRIVAVPTRTSQRRRSRTSHARWAGRGALTWRRSPGRSEGRGKRSNAPSCCARTPTAPTAAASLADRSLAEAHPFPRWIGTCTSPTLSRHDEGSHEER
ncbi:hypothetical protein WME94_37885 [Sorangium sp. So ce429]